MDLILYDTVLVIYVLLILMIITLILYIIVTINNTIKLHLRNRTQFTKINLLNYDVYKITDSYVVYKRINNKIKPKNKEIKK